MMNMKLDNGSFVIEDNGTTKVSPNIADIIKENYIVEDDEKKTGDVMGVEYPFVVTA